MKDTTSAARIAGGVAFLLAALLALAAAPALFGAHKAYAAPTRVTWSVVDVISQQPLDNFKLTVTKESDGTEQTILSQHLPLYGGGVTVEPGETYTVKTERDRYISQTETISVSQDGAISYASKPGKADADYTAELKSERISLPVKVVFEGGPAPASTDIRFNLQGGAKWPYRAQADLNAGNGWAHVFEPPSYINDWAVNYVYVWGVDGERASGVIGSKIVVEGNVYVLAAKDVDSRGGATITYRYERKAIESDTGSEAVNPTQGVEFTVLDMTGDRVIATWADNPVSLEELPDGRYILRQTGAPMGYEPRPDLPVVKGPYRVSVDGDDVEGYAVDGYEVSVRNERTFYPLDVLKTDAGGAALAGARLQVVEKATGAVLDEWASDGSAHRTALAFGGYILREAEAPQGYVGAGDVEFSVAPNGEVAVQGGAARFEGGTLNAEGRREGGVLKLANAKAPEPVGPESGDGGVDSTAPEGGSLESGDASDAGNKADKSDASGRSDSGSKRGAKLAATGDGADAMALGACALAFAAAGAAGIALRTYSAQRG